MMQITIGSSTQALRAQEVLQRGGVVSRLKRQENSADGCIWVIEVDNAKTGRARQLLASAGYVSLKVVEGRG